MKSNIKLTAFIAGMMISATGLAQNIKVKLQLINEKHEIIDRPTVKLYTQSDSLLLETVWIPGTLIQLAAGKQFTFEVSATGIATSRYSLSTADSDTTFSINVQTKARDLDAVVITARKPLIRQEDDKTIIDAETMASTSTNAYEVLEKTPGAVVDQDGNVYLNSATPAQVQINGKEVKLSAADIASLLKSLPANSVVKIEILRNPSAKYDASSSGGIINIVLKKGVKLGTSGSVNAGYFQGKYSTKTLGFNLNRSQGKTNSFLSYQYTNRNNYESLNSHRYINGTDIAQAALTRYPAQNNFVSGGLEFVFNNKFTLGYDGRFSANESRSSAENSVNFINENNGQITGSNQSNISNSGNTYYFGNSINSTYKIDSLGSEWTSSLDYTLFNNNNDQRYISTVLFPAEPGNAGDGNTKGNKNNTVLETDLVWKFKSKITLETGAKFNYSTSKNNALYFANNGGGRKPDSFQTNRFKYREQISSVYLQVSKTLAGFTVKPGLRVEQTDINGNQLFPIDTSLQIKRTDVFPYVYLRHSLVKMFGFQLTGNLIYRKSITRPYYEALNPYPKFIDQFLYDVGNPSLRPQFTSNYEFNIMADQFPVFSIGLNDITDIFTNVTYQDTTTKIAYRTFDNLGHNKEMYLRFVGGIPPGKKYFFYAGAQYNHVDYSGVYQGAPLDYKRGSWTFFMYHNYKPTSSFNVGINAFMRVRGLQNFYELKSFGQLNISATKSILNKKLSVILAANDILRTNKYSFSLEQAGIRASGNRINDTRRIGLTLRYNFGIKPKEEKQPMFEAPAT